MTRIRIIIPAATIERTKLYLIRGAALLLCVLIFPLAAHASPFDSGISSIQTLFTGTVAKAASLIAIVIGGYTTLLVDPDSSAARLSALTLDSTVVPVGGMSEGTVDQLFLSLRLAAVEDVVAAGIKLPFLADDLFINYDDARAGAGFKVLAELAKTTQVLFFTHHQHLLPIARDAVAPGVVSECAMP